MELSKSYNFLFENAGDVIIYRLHKEILKDLNEHDEEKLLAKVMQTPYYKLVESYVKPNGYIGSGMHSWSNWRGAKLHNTPLQDGEAAARLLSYYAIPKDAKMIINFVNAMRNDELMCKEFSYIPPEIERFRNKDIGINSGFSLSLLFATCQALFGYDDEYMQSFVNASFKAFKSVLDMNSIDDITIKRVNSKRKYNYPYIYENTFFPCQYHLEILAHTFSLRTQENIDTIIQSINHLNNIMEEDNAIHVKIGSNYYAPLWAFVRPLKPFTPFPPYGTALRKTITHLAMIGGNKIDAIWHAIKKNNYKSDTKIWCDLTFWAVQLLDTVHRRHGEQ
jgi:hypothetical protein